MITWEPWQNLFVKTNKYGSEEKDKTFFYESKMERMMRILTNFQNRSSR